MYYEILQSLNDEQKKELKEFQDKHEESCGETVRMTAVGLGPVEFIVGMSSLGETLGVRCTICKKEKYITDVSNW